jgi:hypothetical protein
LLEGSWLAQHHRKEDDGGAEKLPSIEALIKHHPAQQRCGDRVKQS